uniref:EamA domain-containing protein n=1 Tax=Emiliania huxleyi TaxID=2903 RepID=A0A6V2VYF5_EMIHU
MRLPAPALAPAWHAANVLARSGSVASSEVRLDDADSALDLQTLSFLVGAAALWGTYPTCVKLLYSAGPPLDPSIVVLLRFIIMAAVSCSALFATTPRFTLLRRYVTAAEAASMAWSEQLERRVPASVYVAALELGILGGLGTFLQTLSLSQIPALTAAVLYSTVNVITPALAALAGANAQEREVSARTWAGCALGLIASCWALVPDVGLLPQSLPASVGGGEGTMLAASFCYAASKVPRETAVPPRLSRPSPPLPPEHSLPPLRGAAQLAPPPPPARRHRRRPPRRPGRLRRSLPRLGRQDASRARAAARAGGRPRRACRRCPRRAGHLGERLHAAAARPPPRLLPPLRRGSDLVPVQRAAKGVGAKGAALVCDDARLWRRLGVPHFGRGAHLPRVHGRGARRGSHRPLHPAASRPQSGGGGGGGSRRGGGAGGRGPSREIVTSFLR